MAGFELIRPSLEALPDYVDALRRGWSPDNVRGAAAAEEQLARIGQDRAAFVESLTDLEAKGGPIRLPDGTEKPRLPGYVRWMWDDGFCGSIGFRFQPGTSELPEWVQVFGHIGYAVVPWRRGQGHATRALAALLPECRSRGLDHVQLTTDADNLASQKVISANGGTVTERFTIDWDAHAGPKLRWRIPL